MPFDRVATLTIRAEGARNDEGEYVPGDIVVEEDVWCQVRDGGFFEQVDIGGTDIIQRSNFSLRWRDDVLTLGPELIEIDLEGRTYTIQSVDDYDARKRLVNLVGSYRASSQ